jgi:hypothetical protein
MPRGIVRVAGLLGGFDVFPASAGQDTSRFYQE